MNDGSHLWDWGMFPCKIAICEDSELPIRLSIMLICLLPYPHTAQKRTAEVIIDPRHNFFDTVIPSQSFFKKYKSARKRDALIKAIKNDTPYTPVISETCIRCNMLNWEYPRSSHGKPDKRNERIYSSETHKTGIIIKQARGGRRNFVKTTEKTPM